MISQNIFLFASPWQIAIVVVFVVLLFGGKKIPELMKGLGSGIKEFKNASKEEDEEKDKIEDKK
jgi:sec-independent protein translocase protein TatA